MSELITAARPYARAAFELAQAGGTMERWSRQLGLMAIVAADPNMAELLDSPAVSRNSVAEVFISVCGEELDTEGRNLVYLLTENGRLPLLGEIFSLFKQMRAEAESSATAEVVSAFPLDDDHKQAIGAALERRTGREIMLDCKVDPALLGGAVIRIGDLVIDGSIRGRLDKMAAALVR